MLTLHLVEDEVLGAWRFDGRSYMPAADALSFVRPYDHPALEHLQVTDGQRTLIIVRERESSSGPAKSFSEPVSPRLYDQIAQQARSWALSFVVAEINPDLITLDIGALGVAPIYVTKAAGRKPLWLMGLLSSCREHRRSSP